MREINGITINKEKLIDTGSEAKVYKIPGGIYKEFTRAVNEDKRQGKRDKLLYLERLEHLKKYYPHLYCLVVTIINRRKIISGYTMENVIGYYLNEIELTYEEKIVILKLIRAILEKFNKEGIIYHDIRLPNIKYTPNKDIVLLDIDSVTTPDNPHLDIIPTQLERYLVNGGKHGILAQRAMFNKFTNSFLEDDYYKKRIILDKDGLMIMRALINSKPNSAYDHEYLYEHIKSLK